MGSPVRYPEVRGWLDAAGSFGGGEPEAGAHSGRSPGVRDLVRLAARKLPPGGLDGDGDPVGADELPRAVGPDPESGAPVIADGQSVLRVTDADAFGADDEPRARERRVGAADMMPRDGTFHVSAVLFGRPRSSFRAARRAWESRERGDSHVVIIWSATDLSSSSSAGLSRSRVMILVNSLPRPSGYSTRCSIRCVKADYRTGRRLP